MPPGDLLPQPALTLAPPENQRPRVADDPRYDFLYRVGHGLVEWYRSERHGVRSIVQDDDSNLMLTCDGWDRGNVGQTSGQMEMNLTRPVFSRMPSARVTWARTSTGNASGQADSRTTNTPLK